MSREVERIWENLNEYVARGYLSREEFDDMNADQAWEWLKDMEASF